VLSSKRIFQVTLAKTYLESSFDASRDSTFEDTRPTDLKNSFSSGKDSYKVFLLYGLSSLWSPKHENVSIKSSNSLRLEVSIRPFIAVKELFYFGIQLAHILMTFWWWLAKIASASATRASVSFIVTSISLHRSAYAPEPLRPTIMVVE
jgi:hypothetical protein